jgi:hypothetical protein
MESAAQMAASAEKKASFADELTGGIRIAAGIASLFSGGGIASLLGGSDPARSGSRCRWRRSRRSNSAHSAARRSARDLLSNAGSDGRDYRAAILRELSAWSRLCTHRSMTTTAHIHNPISSGAANTARRLLASTTANAIQQSSATMLKRQRSPTIKIGPRMS